MQWAILFLALCLVVGAISRVCIPSWIPYTVAVLLLGILVGVGAFFLEIRRECPMNALYKFDRDHNERVSLDEWREFVCEGCVAESICASRACGASLLSDAETCATGFARYDSVFRMSPLHVSYVNDTASDRELSADELWTFSCNGLTDIIQVSNMDPHVMLLVFLPVLLFESAFAVDMGVLRKQIAQIWVLALAGVLAASLLTAGLIQLLKPAWQFNVCWLIGTITSATDPVAVVALLKELGTDKSIGTLIEGESLLNDGSAVVLYVVIKNWIEHTNSDQNPFVAQIDYPGPWIDLVRVVAQMLLFGVVWGVLWGYSLARLLRRVYNDPIAEISLTIGASYLCFWSAEMLMSSSAVIAVVLMGFYMNSRRHSAVSPEVLHDMHEFFDIIAWMFNTIVFFIAGFKLGSLFGIFAMQRDNAEVAMWLLLYPGVLLTRGLTICLLYPLLKNIELGLDWRTAVVMWWGGLRGSVGLALGLIVMHTQYSQRTWGGPMTEAADGTLPCRDIPRDTLFATCIVVLFTVVINGSSVGLLLRFLGLSTVPEDRRFMLNAAAKKLDEQTESQIAAMRKSGALTGVNWKLVEKNLIKVSDLHGEMELSGDNEYKLRHPLVAAWQEALNIERRSYAEQFEQGELGAYASLRLESILAETQAVVNAIARGITEHDTPTAAYAKATNKIIDEFTIPRWALVAETMPIGFVRRYATRKIVQQLKVAYEIGTAFTHAHHTLMGVAKERERQRLRWQKVKSGFKPSLSKMGLGSIGALLVKKARDSAASVGAQARDSAASVGDAPAPVGARPSGGGGGGAGDRGERNSDPIGDSLHVSFEAPERGAVDASAGAQETPSSPGDAVDASARGAEETPPSAASSPWSFSNRRLHNFTAGIVMAHRMSAAVAAEEDTGKEEEEEAASHEDDDAKGTSDAKSEKEAQSEKEARRRKSFKRRYKRLEQSTHDRNWKARKLILDSDVDDLMKVAQLHEQNVQRVHEAMEELKKRSPLITRIVQNIHATNVALFDQRKLISHMREHGELADADAKALDALINHRLKALYHRPMAEWGVNTEQLAIRRTDEVIETQSRHCNKLRAAVIRTQNAVRFAGTAFPGTSKNLLAAIDKPLSDIPKHPDEVQRSITRGLRSEVQRSRKALHLHVQAQRQDSRRQLQRSGSQVDRARNALGFGSLFAGLPVFASRPETSTESSTESSTEDLPATPGGGARAPGIARLQMDSLEC